MHSAPPARPRVPPLRADASRRLLSHPTHRSRSPIPRAKPPFESPVPTRCSRRRRIAPARRASGGCFCFLFSLSFCFCLGGRDARTSPVRNPPPGKCGFRTCAVKNGPERPFCSQVVHRRNRLQGRLPRRSRLDQPPAAPIITGPRPASSACRPRPRWPTPRPARRTTASRRSPDRPRRRDRRAPPDDRTDCRTTGTVTGPRPAPPMPGPSAPVHAWQCPAQRPPRCCPAGSAIRRTRGSTRRRDGERVEWFVVMPESLQASGNWRFHIHGFHGVTIAPTMDSTRKWYEKCYATR